MSINIFSWYSYKCCKPLSEFLFFLLYGGYCVIKNVKILCQIFKTLYFLNPLMALVYIWYNYRCWSKILLSPIHTPAYDLEVKVTDLQI